MGSARDDVAIVGGGIAGGALALLLARAGLAVTVLEQSTTFRDKVRGETMPPWGYAELIAAGLVDVMVKADGALATHYVPYGDTLTADVAEVAAMDASVLLPGVPGSLNLSHPLACQLLLDSAEAAGARVVRGIRQVQVTAGQSPSVTYQLGGRDETVAARLLVGADGRSSTVRRQIGIELATTGARTFGAGVLVEGLHGWPAGRNSLGTWGDVHFLVFPRTDGRARIYLMFDKADPSRFAGEDGGRRILRAMMGLACLPDPGIFAEAEAQPGWASYPMSDTWTDKPFVEGVVLIGDAAGYNDPIIGQGLSIAVRDARLVAEALLAEPDWSPTTFEGYATERTERMRRLRATAETVTRLRCDFSPEGKQRRAAAFSRIAADPAARLPIAAGLLGPHNLPPEAFTREAADRLLALP